MTASDVAVIGGGIIGCAVAYEVAQRGRSVTVLDRAEPGAGASGVGGGFISLATKKAGPHRDLAKDSARLYETLEEELEAPPGSLGYRRRGSILFAEGEDELPALERLARHSPEARFERLSPGDLTRLEPSLSPCMAGGLYFPDDAEVFPRRVLDAYRRAGERLGVKFRHPVRIRKAERAGSGWTLQADNGTWSAPNVVICAGAWSGEVGALFGLSVPVKPRRGQALLVPMSPGALGHPLLSAGYFSAKHRAEGTADEVSVQLSLWQRPDGRLYAGGTREWAGFDDTANPSALREIRRRAEGVLPALADAPGGRPLLGFRPYSETGLPLIGPVEDRPGLYLATGHEGDGICLAPITGQLVGQLLAGEPPMIDPRPFSALPLEPSTSIRDPEAGS